MSFVPIKKGLSRTLHAIIFSYFICAAWGDDWSQFGGPNRNFSALEVPQDKSAALRVWSTAISGGDASVVIRKEKMVVSAIDFASDGTDAHRIACLDRFDGKLLWEQTFAEISYLSQDIGDRFPVRPVSTPCIMGDRIIVCGFGASVRCLDLLTGIEQWSVDLVKEYGSKPIQYGYACSPWCNEEQVVVGCGGDEALLLSLNIKDGTMNWRCGSGQASYASPMLMPVHTSEPTDTSEHLIYAGGNEIIGVDAKNGNVLWRYSYPAQGLTNAVTPIAVAAGKLLIGGQGVEGCRLLSIEKNGEGYSVTEDWHNSKVTPFYCNWIQLPSNSKCVGFIGKTLTAMDWATGEVLWQKRNWTDSNLLGIGGQALAVRGDGFVGLLNVDEKGCELVAGEDSVKDRIWAPPTLVDQQLYLIGRNALFSFPLSQLKKVSLMPSGTEVTSMDAMYGNRPERIQKLIDLTKAEEEFPIEEYLAIASDRSLQLGEGDYQTMLNNLNERNASKAAFEMVSDWKRRSPFSIAAWQRYVQLLRKSGKADEADLEQRERLVEVTIELTTPKGPQMPDHIYLTGNVDTLGPWKPTAIELEPISDNKYKTKCFLPRGDFQFKFTCGSMDSIEVRSDGRSISNRRHRITGPTTLDASVQAWKK